jgi:hypothetical protein
MDFVSSETGPAHRHLTGAATGVSWPALPECLAAAAPLWHYFLELRAQNAEGQLRSDELTRAVAQIS